jgi:hypothetical protein
MLEKPDSKNAIAKLALLSGEIYSNPVFTEEQVRLKLAIDSPELTEELYQIAQQQIQSEIGRQTRLDAKATSLLTAAGLSLTIVFTFGNTLVTQTTIFNPCILIGYVVAVTCGLVAASFAVSALRVRSAYFSIDERVTLDPAMLKEANQPEAFEGKCELKDEEKRRYGVMEYRKYLLPQLWVMGQTSFRNHEKKATLVKRGQYFFLAFLSVSLLVCVLVVFGVLSIRDKKATTHRDPLQYHSVR